MNKLDAERNSNEHPLGKNAHLYEIDKSEKVGIRRHESEITELHREDLRMYSRLKDKTEEIGEELLAGFEAVNQYPKTVTVFGSARTPEGTKEYEDIRRISGKVCRMGYAILTGGGPGIMEAANRGATETCGYSLGFNINLPFEQHINPYVTHGLDFDYFSPRKMAMFFSAEAYIYCPGGFGTLDELFQLLTLIQTKKAPRTPVILLGSSYWNKLQRFINDTMLEEFNTISKEDMDLYTITDNDDEILEIIKNAPERGKYE